MKFLRRQQVFEADNGGKKVILSFAIVIFCFSNVQLCVQRKRLDGSLCSCFEIIKTLIVCTDISDPSQEIKHTNQLVL